MAFRVYKYEDDEPIEFGPNDKWKVFAGGVLEIKREDGSKLLFSHIGWAGLEQDAPSPENIPRTRFLRRQPKR